ncbi:Transcriptional regulator MraZ [Tenacibaculum sp. 190524A05c]|uniref:Transcriptional regulator MraZ n=1 Tax=Tenacibaculum platacis TaxID=3137852 RepID=A0ABP1EUW3_9FLAO
MVNCGKYFIFLNNTCLRVVNIIGTYECKADAKGRLMVASALKKQLSPVLEEGFVIKRSVFQPCLELYPMQEWNQMMAKINKLNRFVKKNNDFIRRFTAGVKVVEMDSAGRILIPKDLCVFAGIEKQVVLSSAVNIIEIWDKDKYESVIEDTASDFADLAEEVMGNIEIDE